MFTLLPWLMVAHIAVLGYWLGSELVINSTYRYVAFRAEAPFPERARLMDHVMDVDQHVRYALILQAALGTMIAAIYGYIPGGSALVAAAAVAGILWLAFVEAVHRLRGGTLGRRLAAIDRFSRYGLLAILVAIAAGLVGGSWPVSDWLRWKLALFAGVVLCGIGIRLALIAHFRTWAVMARDGPTDETNAIVRAVYCRATAILVLLWLFIAAITVLSIAKPA